MSAVEAHSVAFHSALSTFTQFVHGFVYNLLFRETVLCSNSFQPLSFKMNARTQYKIFGVFLIEQTM